MFQIVQRKKKKSTSGEEAEKRAGSSQVVLCGARQKDAIQTKKYFHANMSVMEIQVRPENTMTIRSSSTQLHYLPCFRLSGGLAGEGVSYSTLSVSVSFYPYLFFLTLFYFMSS